MTRALEIHGLHAPNCRFCDFRTAVDGPAEGEHGAWNLVYHSRAEWIKLLWPDHSRADAAMAFQVGVTKTLVRAPGEGIVHWADVAAMIEEFRGLCHVIEVGNEPAPGQLWEHAWHLEEIWRNCAPLAHGAGIRLCTPGWAANVERSLYNIDFALGRRLLEVYDLYDAIGVHLYDPFDLRVPAVRRQLAAWSNVNAFRSKPIFITEYGIAARNLVAGQAESDREKARRYAAFIRELAEQHPRVEAAFAFILGGTSDWATFNAGGYDPAGVNSYWLAPEAWKMLGRELAGY